MTPSAREAPPGRACHSSARRPPRGRGPGRRAPATAPPSCRPPRRRRRRGRHPIPRPSASAAGCSSTAPPSRSRAPASARSPPPASSPSCGRPPPAGSASRSTVGKLDDILETIRTGDGFFYAPAPARGSPSTRPTPWPRPQVLPRRASARRAWRPGIVALYQKCPHLGCRVPHARPASGSSARATARSTTGSARRRPARRRAAWTASRSPSPATATSPSTPGAIVAGPPIGTNTTGQEAEGPHCITGGGEH